MSKKIILQTVSRVFILMTILGLFLTCDDGTGPLSSNMGPKVVVEPPTIHVETPRNKSFISGKETITGVAKAYIAVKKIEMKILANPLYGQQEIPWKTIWTPASDKQAIKNLEWEYEFDTKLYNKGKDGFIQMIFRVFDSTFSPVESITYLYTIKNNPSEIVMAYPGRRDIINATSSTPTKVNYKGEIRGQVIDVKGLKPGYPQIKIWPLDDPRYSDGITEPGDDDPDYGYASLFLASCDKIDEVDLADQKLGVYADRSKLPVVTNDTFRFKLAEFKIDPTTRKIRYEKDANNKHVPFGANKKYNFRIKTKDTSFDTEKGLIPTDDDEPLIGFFPPANFTDPPDPNENPFIPGDDPVRIVIFSSDARPDIEINNDDLGTDEGTRNEILNARPNIYITEPTSKKIAFEPSPVKDVFRLRLKVSIKEGVIDKGTLEYLHEDSGRAGDLNSYLTITNSTNSLPAGEAYFTFTADSGMKGADGKQLFTTSSGPYSLIFTVWIGENKTERRYYVYMDGESPKVSIRSVRGAAKDPTLAASLDPDTGGLINASPYTVNGNIQVVVDRTDDSGIMAFRQDANMGKSPPGNEDGYPMVKWVVEPFNENPAAPATAPASTGTILEKLIHYKAAPNANNLDFFNSIGDTVTSIEATGWVRKPVSGATGADSSNNFKLNTSFSLADRKYYWLYVIAMDQVQNLGFIAQKIYVDQDSDKPVVDIPALFKTNASDQPVGGVPIAGPVQLEVDVTVGSPANIRNRTGNWSSSRPRRNILERDQPIEMNIRDDDGIDMASDPCGISITLTVLDPVSDITGTKEVTFNTGEILKAITSDTNKNKRDISLKLTQQIMAKKLYGSAYKEGDGLKDGMYRIDIKVDDDIKEKVEITPNTNPGDKPDTASSGTITYWFAVSTEMPEVRIVQPDDNAWGSEEPIIIKGTARSRLEVRSAWITFSPDVINPSTQQDSVSDPQKIDLKLVAGTPGADGYYMYTWEYAGKDGKGVVFHPQNGPTAYYTSGIRRFTVEAWDRVGNMGNAVRTVQIDATPPDVTLSDYNYGRPYEEYKGDKNVSVLYGKVSFTVSASDANGLYEVDGKSGIKWWILPYSDPDPSWSTGYTDYPKPSVNVLPDTAPATWTGGGNFNLNQSKGGRYTWVIDTRYLTNETTKYKLCIVALDRAGNQSRIVLEKDGAGNPTKTTTAYEPFYVDQSRDYPVLDELSLDPLQDQVKGKGTTISGSVSDADFFNPANRDKYVEIRFPKSPTAGKPAVAADWNEWIPIKIPETYSSMNGGLDPSGAIVFKFRQADYKDIAAVNSYLNSDGIKYYQIRVWDEPVGPTKAQKQAGAKYYGKNPDYFMVDAPDEDGDNGNYSPYPYVLHDKVSIVYPKDTANLANPTPPDSYRFIVDDTFPEIFFDTWDPTPGHPNFSEARPTFSKAELLVEALKGYVQEYKLSDLSMSYSGKLLNGTTETFRKLIINNLTEVDDPPDGKYLWPRKAKTSPPAPAPITSTEFDLTGADMLLKQIFDEAPEGMQIIVFEATDMVPLTRRVSYIFAKDTQGPEIDFRSIARSIKRDVLTPSFPTAASNPPAWPSDWRYRGTAWNAWGPTWKQVIDSWPSEYAFKEQLEITKKLKEENDRTPTTVIGDPEDKKTTNPTNYSAPVLEGTFSDLYSSVRILVPVNNPDPTYFYYRFKKPDGTVQPIPEDKKAPAQEVLGDWMRKEIEKLPVDANGKPTTQNEKGADWKIYLNADDGFTGTDGENWVDIWVKDTAGNISDIYNVRFYLDRTAPILGEDPNPDDPKDATKKISDADEFIVHSIANWPSALPAWTPKWLPENERVFSAAGGDGDTEAFTLKGKVSDHNFSGLTITIGQEGYGGYTVTASLGIDPAKIGSPDPAGVISAPVDKVNNLPDSTSQKRLSLTKLAADYKGAPQWEWTLKVLQKDVKGLRDAAKNGTTDDSDRARRYIRVTASDKASKRVGPVDWFFYLDTKKPALDYTNLEPGKETKASSFEDSKLALSGIVSDDTRIQDVKYMIGKWVYGTGGGWRWWNGTAWALPAPPAISTWPSAFDKADAPGGAHAPRPTPSSSMTWSINQATLNAAPAVAFENTATKKLFDQEGYYRLELYITDFSLGNGNPHDTTVVIDDNYSDKGNYKDPWPENTSLAGKPNSYDPKTGDGYRSGRVFYVDKKDPDLQWGWVTWNPETKKWELDDDDIYNTTNKTYFRNDGGQAKFSFTVGDGNTIKEWSAKVTDSTGTTTALNSDTPSLKWEAKTGDTTAKRPIPAPATSASVVISDTAIDNQKLIIAPFMTSDGQADATPDAQKALDVVAKKLLTYTITITVKDGANRESTISKQFTLDNTPPRFIQDKFQPLSYKQGATDAAPAGPDTVSAPGYVPEDTIRSYSYDAVTGRLNIRGNTEDNSNQIKSISYYVVNSSSVDGSGNVTFNASNFPNPKAITTWRSSVDKNSEIFASDNKTTLIQIDEGTFAWKIMVPQTSLFLTGDAAAKTYVQKTFTGGKDIHGDTKPAGKYWDVKLNSDGTVTVPNNQVDVPQLRFPDLNNSDYPENPTRIYGNEDVGLITVYVRAEDAAGNVAYDLVKYWIWPEGDRPIVTAINNPDSTKIEIERLLNGTIRISGMAKDNERVKNVWFRILDPDKKPYTTLEIPVWKETDGVNNNTGTPIGGNWEARTGNQSFELGANIGAIRKDDSFTPPATNADGWYKANGGNSRDVSWWVYVNTKGELDPTGTEESKKFTVEVRAQDVTYDDKNDKWMDYTASYRGMASIPKSVDAWVVAGAPIFEKAFVAPVDSVKATKDGLWQSIDNLNIRNRSAYRVTVKHNSGLSAIRWSPTLWDKTLNGGNGGFQANPAFDTFNLLAVKPADYPLYEPGMYVYLNPAGTAYMVGTETVAFKALTDKDTSMAMTVSPRNIKKGSDTLRSDRKYMVWQWDEALETSDAFPYLLGTSHDPTHYYVDNGVSKHKDMRNSVFSPTTTKSYSIGNAILIESMSEDGDNNVQYFKWDIFVDVNADMLLNKMTYDDPNYGKVAQYPGRAGQVENSVRYPVYLSASEVSKSTPFTTRGDTLLPIDNLPPKGMYTLNRKPAGSAATIGGEAGDDGPVSGVARVVLWFQRGAVPLSWHEQATTSLPTPGVFKQYTSGGPTWWDEFTLPAGAVSAGAKKPALGAEKSGTGGDSAIVIDRNSPTTKQEAWGHQLAMGFADGGMGKYWYVEIDTFGIVSGPVELHFVVIDKAGNYKYYKERLVIMNNVAVIDRIKLATDIRHNSWSGTDLAGNKGMDSGYKYEDKATTNKWPILQKIRDVNPLGGPAAEDPRNDIKKGISDWVYTSAMSPDKIIDFNVRNNLFALRVETTKGPGAGKSRNFRLEYVNSARLLENTLKADGTPDKTELLNMKAGRVYIINEPGTARWGALGADGDGPWPRGYAFIAVINGREPDENDTLIDKITGTGSAWELNYGYYNANSAERVDANIPNNLKLADVKYATLGDASAESAEFVYANSAFDAASGSIVDYNGPADIVFPPAANTAWTTWTNANYSLFILRVFDGDEKDIFGDFKIIRVRVNNDDRTIPFAQLYDLNPKTEGQERQNIPQTDNQNDFDKEEARSLAPMFIGEGTNSNRTKGGLWNISRTLGSVEKPGHIEPRTIAYTTAPYDTQQHSLSSAQMGGAATPNDATIQKPFADPRGFFTADTVSGRVVLRGYAEDDQRVQRVSLKIGSDAEFNILEYQNNGAGVADTDANRADYKPPQTGLLQIPTAQKGKVYFSDSIDLYRHRVEWVYIWDTETAPAGTVVGNNINVRVRSYARNGATGGVGDTNTKNPSGGANGNPAPGTAHTNTPAEATKPNTSLVNPGFPIGMNKYDSINFNLRPYITGFLRNKNDSSHNTRSRQGRYMFFREETAVVKGFNLNSSNGASASTMSINNGANWVNVTDLGNVGAYANYDITETDANVRNRRYRQFTVPAGAVTGNGIIRYTFNQYAVNTFDGTVSETRGERKISATPRPTYIQPWNIEYSPGLDGSKLWDDFIQAHIWQSNNTAPGAGNNTATNGSGYFFSRESAAISNPAMSINPRTGTLYESHNGSGGTSDGGDFYNTGRTIKSPITINDYGNDTATRARYWVTQFSDPIFFSDVYRRPTDNDNDNNAETWVVSSIIGRSGILEHWRGLGGIYISGPGGSPIAFTGGGTGSGQGNNGVSFQNSDYSSSLYYGESTWYNASDMNKNTAPGGRLASPPSTDQFMNPHIVTSIVGSAEHIHVSYYDDLTGAIKYRYNLRGTPDTSSRRIDGGAGTTANDTTNNNSIPKLWVNLDGGSDHEDNDQTTNLYTGATIAEGARITTGRGSNIKAGKHNSIAVTGGGFPVVAYYDQTNQRLKLAVSSRPDPILGANWTIIPNISSVGTGEFVSMKINTVAGANPGQELNRVHIAAMNTNKRLVYITFVLNGSAIGTITEQVVDSVGNVGRWCALSLDADGNPWISYMDESYLGSRDGVKLAYKNTNTFYKGGSVYRDGEDKDINNNPINGREAMHIPTRFRVVNKVISEREHGRLGMECFPARNYSPNNATKFWSGAVGYISTDAISTGVPMERYRIAYYVK